MYIVSTSGNYGLAVDCQPQHYILRVQSFWVYAIRWKQQSHHSIVVLFVIVDKSGLIWGLREHVPFQEKPKRIATVHYANEGMLTAVLNNE